MAPSTAPATLSETMSQHRCQTRRHADDPGGSGGATSLLDAAALARLRQLDPDGSRDFLVQVLRTYESSLARHLATLELARTTGDLKTAGDIAHTLKSSSASVGALAFAEGCARLERQARAEDAAALSSTLIGLQGEGARVLAAVRAMLPT